MIGDALGLSIEVEMAFLDGGDWTGCGQGCAVIGGWVEQVD